MLYAELPTLLFLNNIYGLILHTWSIAVEFQMYIISPFILKLLFRYQGYAIFIAWVIFSISASLQLIVF